MDTSVIIDLGNLDLGDFGAAEPVVSAVSVAELSYGLDVSDPVERSARADRYYDVLDDYEVLSFDIAAAKIYGTLAALVRQSGRNPRPRRMDLQIAATAAVHGLPLVTQNAKDFVGLERLLDVVAIGQPV